jgi:L-aspartate oxidase
MLFHGGDPHSRRQSRPADRERVEADVTVVGAGLAGLWSALTAAREGARVVLVTTGDMDAAASYWAQGGIAAALAGDDSPERHAEDTQAAGRRASRSSAVDVLCREIPDCIGELEELGLRFDRQRDGRLALGREGGHRLRRVAHAGGSATGRALVTALCRSVGAHPGVRILEHTRAAALTCDEGRCTGLVADAAGGGRLLVSARATVLATGGAAALWQRTTNPAGAVGTGLLLAHAAGAALADLEFVQFHPTALVARNGGDGFLLTEALRGEGALLLGFDGERFVDELAPRDQVALAIAGQMREHPGSAVRLDLRRIALEGFPNIAAALDRHGLHPERDPIPVAPAAHYMMGGIVTDLHGRSTLPGLYAVGECACTGVHGANRLASNSLAECLVFGRRAGLSAASEPAVAPGPVGQEPAPLPRLTPATRRRLWHHAGVERDAGELEMLLDDPHPLARLIAASALAREETRGAHQRRDHPGTEPRLDGHHVVVRGDAAPALEAWR